MTEWWLNDRLLFFSPKDSANDRNDATIAWMEKPAEWMSANIVHERFSSSLTIMGAPDTRWGRMADDDPAGDQFWNVRSRLAVRKRLHFTYRWRDARGIYIIRSFRVLNSAIRSQLSLTDS